MHDRGMVNSRMPIQERCRSRNGEPALQSAGLPDVARRRKSLKLAGLRPVMAVKSFGDRGAQGGEGIRPRIVETRRRPSRVFVNGTGTITYLPHDRFTIRGGDLAKAQRSMSRNHADDARFMGLAATAATAAVRFRNWTNHRSAQVDQTGRRTVA